MAATGVREQVGQDDYKAAPSHSESRFAKRLMSSESDAFPDPVFELLLDKLVHALEITQSSQSTLTPQTRQAIFQAVCSVYASS